MTDGGSWEYNDRIEALRDYEFPMLKDNVYLDHAGTTLYAKSLMDKFATDMTTNLFGNPHSASASSQASMSRIEDIRVRVLQFFNADPSEFDLVFVANATAGIKLVADAFRGSPGGFDFLYHQACHTSLVGVRQEAENSLCLDDDAVRNCLESGGKNPLQDLERRAKSTLFAYPAQSNMNGQRFPLSWSERMRKCGAASGDRFFTLLDAAAFAATSPLDLGNSENAPDFTVLSFYKLFGFPDLGGLIVRRQAAPVFQHRRYFGGGTVDMVACVKEHWHATKTQSLHESLEDGTLPIHNIIALDSALDVHQKLYGSMKDVSSHTAFLSRRLYDGFVALQHGNGEAVCAMYSTFSEQTDDDIGNGPVLAFNLRSHLGAWVSLAEFEKLAVLKQFHIRTGGLCNPGGIASALGLEPWEIRRNFSAGFRCGNDNDVMSGKPTGVIRVSMGAMSTASDVDKFIDFIYEFYCTRITESEPSLWGELLVQQDPSDLYVETIMVYPIKSCGGYRIPIGSPWEVRPEGLTWDREWCLVHRGTGRALSQKQYPRMALIRPVIDFSTGHLRISYRGPPLRDTPGQVLVPLSANPDLFRPSTSGHGMTSRVCGEEISAQVYRSDEVSNFFSRILGVPCALARFPPGGLGKGMRHAKAHLQNHQKVSSSGRNTTRCHLPSAATPPDSDSESEQRRILLSNESPILAINLSSLEALNRKIAQRGGKAVSAEVFRANIVIRSSTPKGDSFAYSEDHWSRLRIGKQSFKMLGACRRCHMVCIDQETANKSEEPFITLTKTRRFDGKVLFGTHMCHVPVPGVETKEAQFPTIAVGDEVVVDPV
ncbi:Uu.00g039920.m01.CDS01 [Anthostomella pinea]|uniref:Molybdenum cofactor sulfurase n=1 Tax=Anthostomella pinea TaxID=933095 RepID=A0AAI8VA32_9PEZI|nr:Uu.00g039920.m01.CDS01 [Anthostomella pinea]